MTDYFVNECFYHLYNKTIDEIVPFSEMTNSEHFLKLCWFYRALDIKVSYSKYNLADFDVKKRLAKRINNPINFQVEILAFCLMPNHYHLLLKQNFNCGITKFMNSILNAFTRYFNLINSRKGPVFIPGYKAKLINSEEELVHVSRYIHLNPYSSGLVNSFDELAIFNRSSFREYLKGSKLCNSSYVMNTSYFNNKISKYKKFVENHTDYQRSLNIVRYLEKWP